MNVQVGHGGDTARSLHSESTSFHQDW